ncbi:signal peptidase I [Candidatus Woesearchaeota archaeon]|nr:signal peptidase I [Candidatus Woesearchaeota archaeon]
MKRDFKNFLKKAWYFIWYDDSLLSWFLNVIIAFILVKFIIYPGIGLILGTSHPLVAVVSCSMDHNADFENWWQANGKWYEDSGITKKEFSEFSFKNGINQGDIMVLKNNDNIGAGDVIVFNGRGNPIIHRVIEENEQGFRTKGDNNPVSDIEITNSLIGKAVFRIPYLGWIKIAFNGLIGQGIIKC